MTGTFLGNESGSAFGAAPTRAHFENGFMGAGGDTSPTAQARFQEQVLVGNRPRGTDVNGPLNLFWFSLGDCFGGFL